MKKPTRTKSDQPLMVHLSAAQGAALRSGAQRRGVSMGQLVRELVNNAMKGGVLK